MFGEEETFFTCPYCFESISFVLESLYDNQEYIEDCEVCCQPIQIRYQAQDGEIKSIQVDKA